MARMVALISPSLPDDIRALFYTACTSMYRLTQTKAEALEQLSRLVVAFADQHAHYQGAAYKESQLRNDFLNPLLKTLGWDVDNELGKSQYLRDVVQEEELAVEEDDVLKMKNPDYTLRVAGSQRLFVEAKKVAVNVERSPNPAFQTRRYGWSANLVISVLTNFERLIIYDCRIKPSAGDDPHLARYRSYHYTEFISHFEEIYALLSFEAVTGGAIERSFAVAPQGASPFDEFFLHQIIDWRQRLAQSILATNATLNEEDINFQVQRLLNRIIFLRICEDRALEQYETLHAVTSYEELKTLFLKADRKYNSGLFGFIEDTLSLSLQLDSQLLIAIFNELYYPQSPFDFSVVDPEILSQIYERFLGSRISIEAGNQVRIVEEPEVAASDGVVPTPKLVVRKIVRDTLGHLVAGKSFEEVLSLKIADISCGSGTFLIAAYDYLVQYLTDHVSPAQVQEGLARPAPGNTYQLTLRGKQAVVTQCLYGVDINPYAVEVTRFSLSLKLVEEESAATIADHLSQPRTTVLPNLDASIRCGNSLLDDTYFAFNPQASGDDALLFRIRPFQWTVEFPFLSRTGGFDAIIGNPPYVRIQHMVQYAAEEIAFYRSTRGDYPVTGGSSGSFDKYYLFIQRALTLLNRTGYLGYIVPNKFFTIKGAAALRSYIWSHSSLAKVVHFGVQQLFPGRLTYTAIVVLSKQPRTSFAFTRVRNVAQELLGEPASSSYAVQDYGAAPWMFVSPETKALFERIRAGNTVPLHQIADIPVGLQNSNNKLYIIQPTAQSATTFRFLDKNKDPWEIEKAICVPTLNKLAFNLFDTIEANAWMIYPYALVGGQATLLDEQTLQQDYPLCWAYLSHHRAELEARNINGFTDPLTDEPYWYQYGRTQSLGKFDNAPKLLFPVLSTQPKYVYDTTNIRFTGGGSGPYNSILSTSDYSLLYLMGILSHPVFEGMVKARPSEFSGGYYSHGKQYIKDLPIRRINFAVPAERALHDELVDTVQALIAATAQLKTTPNPANKQVVRQKIRRLHEQMFTQVDQLYGLAATDKDIVTGDELLYAPTNETD